MGWEGEGVRTEGWHGRSERRMWWWVQESIMTFFYLWAMQLTAPEDCPPGTLYEPTWQLREVQQIGMQTLI